DYLVRGRLAGLLVLDSHAAADGHDVGVDLRLVDHRRLAQLVLELGDPRLEHRLLVLGVVVFGVLADVAELARDLDPLGNLGRANGVHGLDFLLELLEALACEYYFSRHDSGGFGGLTAPAGRVETGQYSDGPKSAKRSGVLLVNQAQALEREQIIDLVDALR